MASPAGGMEIEKVAAETPELIFKEYIDPTRRVSRPFQARKLAFALGLEGPRSEAGRQADDAPSTRRSWRPTRR